jgi:hypothetical protein
MAGGPSTDQKVVGAQEGLVESASHERAPNGRVEVVTQRELFWAWLPLWVSWFAMALEVPVITSAISRLPDPAVNLAALGGILIPVSFIIEAPILMLLSAATALCRDRLAYRFLFRVMMVLGSVLSVVHLLIALTPLYDTITRDILGCPEEVREAARVGFLVMTPWTWSIAYRRFLQGVVIRLGRSRLVGFGTVVRLATNIVTVLVCFYGIEAGGALTGAAALTAGVMAEALFIGVAARVVVRERLREADPVVEPLTLPRFFYFYAPLALTALLDFLIQPLSSGALSRMPEPVTGLALLPVVGGLMFLLRGPGFAFNEVVISMHGREGAALELARFARRLTLLSGAVGLLFMATPLGAVWFSGIVKLPPEMVVLARQALWLALPTLLAATVKSLYGGTLVSLHRTRAISEGTIWYVLTFSFVVSVGIVGQSSAGIFVVIGAMSTAAIAQVLWLRKRSLER